MECTTYANIVRVIDFQLHYKLQTVSIKENFIIGAKQRSSKLDCRKLVAADADDYIYVS